MKLIHQILLGLLVGGVLSFAVVAMTAPQPTSEPTITKTDYYPGTVISKEIPLYRPVVATILALLAYGVLMTETKRLWISLPIAVLVIVFFKFVGWLG